MQSTCDQPVDIEKFTGCQCEDAQKRIASGEINCATDSCPEDCEACKVCLYYVVDNCLQGTVKIDPGFIQPTLITSSPTPAPTPTPPEVDDDFDQMTCSTYTSIW